MSLWSHLLSLLHQNPWSRNVVCCLWPWDIFFWSIPLPQYFLPEKLLLILQSWLIYYFPSWYVSRHLNLLKTVLDHLLCAFVTSYIQAITTLITVYSATCLLFLGDCRFLKAGTFLYLLLYSQWINRAWHIINTHKNNLLKIGT